MNFLEPKIYRILGAIPKGDAINIIIVPHTQKSCRKNLINFIEYDVGFQEKYSLVMKLISHWIREQTTKLSNLTKRKNI